MRPPYPSQVFNYYLFDMDGSLHLKVLHRTMLHRILSTALSPSRMHERCNIVLMLITGYQLPPPV